MNGWQLTVCDIHVHVRYHVLYALSLKLQVCKWLIVHSIYTWLLDQKNICVVCVPFVYLHVLLNLDKVF